MKMDIELATFLDADMAILGVEPEAYQAYAEAVRKEHKHIPGFLYRPWPRQVFEIHLGATAHFSQPIRL